jgi:anti-sigma factor RsiW
MNDCPNGEMRDRLPELLHGQLQGAERAAMEEHVASCADCQAELALLAGMRGALSRAPAANVADILFAIGKPPIAPAHAPSAPAQATPLHRTRTRDGWGGWRAAAAIAAITVGGAAVAVARHEPAVVGAPRVAIAPRVAVDSPLVARTPETTTVATTTRAPQAGPRATRQLAVSGDVSDLSDRELAALLGELESLEVLPSADVEAGVLVPANGSGESEGVL